VRRPRRRYVFRKRKRRARALWLIAGPLVIIGLIWLIPSLTFSPVDVEDVPKVDASKSQPEQTATEDQPEEEQTPNYSPAPKEEVVPDEPPAPPPQVQASPTQSSSLPASIPPPAPTIVERTPNSFPPPNNYWNYGPSYWEYGSGYRYWYYGASYWDY
jgi:hypothetical protein